MWPVKAMAPTIRENRKQAAGDNSFRKLEDACSNMISGSLNLYRDLRDATAESLFFQIYGSMIALGEEGEARPALQSDLNQNLRELPYVKEAIAAIDKGGFPEAVFRIGALAGRFAGNIPLTRLEEGQEFVRSDKALSKLTADEIRRLRSDAGVMALLEPERTLEALPHLLSNKEDRDRVISILEWVMSLEGISEGQKDLGKKIIASLQGKLPAATKKAPARKKKSSGQE